MNRINFSCVRYFIILALIFVGTPSWAQQIPDRCMYAFVAASARTAILVSTQITQLGNPQAFADAHRAVQLSRLLKCPQQPMLNAIDCAVQFVIDRSGKQPTDIQIVDCVEKHSGRELPKFRN